ncbi:MAG: alpha/beta hydrolase [Fibrobacteres bacterium]|nr:alpha/beta hydrolase [Fibrobacterota bacterium]
MSGFHRKALGGLLGCLAVMSGLAHAGEEFLWPKGAPGAMDTTNASKPSVTYFPADAGTAIGTSAVICPGGGYDHVAMDKEGYQIAKWLNTQGVSAFVLKYRVAPYHHPIEMNDAQRAMRFVRANAVRYRIDPARIGIVGFSAGGHLASTVATHYDSGNPSAPDTVDRQSCKPYFQILAYPVITMEGPFVHLGSRANLLGSNPAPETMHLLSNEKQVDARTPSAFLVHCKDDPDVLLDNTMVYYDSLIKAGVPVQMKLYDHGPHGFGLANGVAGAPNLPTIATWTTICATWMKDRGYLKPSTSIIQPAGTPAALPLPAAAGAWRGGIFDFLGRWRRAHRADPPIPR